jgi:hypothetical protein
MNALTNELLNGVFDIAQVTMFHETPGKISYRTTVALKFAQPWSFGTCRRMWWLSVNNIASSGTYEVTCWESSPCACK